MSILSLDNNSTAMNEESNFPMDGHAFQLVKSDQNQALSLFLPGASYHTDQPVFYYISRLLTAKKGPVLKANNINIPLEAISEVFEQQRKYFDHREFFLVAKSSGTIQAGYLINQLPALKKASVIWITPLLNDNTLFQQMQNYKGQSLVIVGDDDWSYQHHKLEQLKALPNYKIVHLEGANHDLESGKKLNLFESLDFLKVIIQSVANFAGIELQEKKEVSTN